MSKVEHLLNVIFLFFGLTVNSPIATNPAPTAHSTPSRRWAADPAAMVAAGTPSPAHEEFVVHRVKTVPTLHNVVASSSSPSSASSSSAAEGVTPRLFRAKEKFNTDTKVNFVFFLLSI